MTHSNDGCADKEDARAGHAHAPHAVEGVFLNKVEAVSGRVAVAWPFAPYCVFEFHTAKLVKFLLNLRGGGDIILGGLFGL